MSRLRYLLTSVVIVGLVALLVGTTAAAPRQQPKPPKRAPKPARITWTPKRVIQTLTPGQTALVDVTLTSSSDLTNVQLRLPGTLGKRVHLSTPQIASLPAGVATTVSLTITMPADSPADFSGVVMAKPAKGRAVPGMLSVQVKAAAVEAAPAPDPSLES